MKWPLMRNSITMMDRIKLIQFILFSDTFTKGKNVISFENDWDNWLGSKYSLFVSSGSTANLLLLSAIKELFKFKNGDKVLVPACTWSTNISPIIQLGFTPIFCDINLENFSFDLTQLDFIKQNHPDIKLIFVTHLMGFPANNSILNNFFPEAIILDDVCESHGCLDTNNTKIGANSLGATFSFYFGHHMTTIEGGMVSTNNKSLYDLMRMKRSHGLARESLCFEQYAEKYKNIDKNFIFITDSYNFRNHEICAVLGKRQLKRLDKNIEIRNKNFKIFCEIINSFENLFYPIYSTEQCSNYCFPIISRNKSIYNNLVTALKNNGIEYRPIMSGNMTKHPFVDKHKITDSKIEHNVDILHNFGVYVGNNQFVSNKDLDFLRGVLKSLQ